MLRKVIGHLPHIAYACLPACGITEIGRHFYKKKRERKGKTNQSTTMCETVGEGGEWGGTGNEIWKEWK